MNVIIRRTGALGDVVLATPVVRRVHRENPDARIAVQTAHPDVFRNNPHVDSVIGSATLHAPGSRVVDLDLAYERRPDMHVVEAYMLEAFGDAGDPADRQQELFPPRIALFGAAHRYVAVHAAKAGWANRTLPSATWRRVCAMLRDEGFWPILVGTERDALPGAVATSFHSQDLLAQAAMIASCRCFVGSDSALLHIAGAFSVPIVGMFTCARPERRLPWRGGTLGGDCRTVVPNLGCVGCLERRPPPVTTESCEREDIACVSAVTAESIVEAVFRVLATQSLHDQGRAESHLRRCS